MERYRIEAMGTVSTAGVSCNPTISALPDADGKLVLTADHQQALAAERERVTELEAQCAGWKGREALTYDELIDQRDAANERAERAEAALSRIAYLLRGEQ